jgi:flagellar hook-associated protein 3 FlgL
MRVTTNSNDSQMLAQIQKLTSLQTRLQTQVSTGQRIFQPEDDPAAMGRVLALETEKSRLPSSPATRAMPSTFRRRRSPA